MKMCIHHFMNILQCIIVEKRFDIFNTYSNIKIGYNNRKTIDKHFAE